MWRWAAVLLCFFAPAHALAYTNEPLINRDGFSGEPTCRECHVHDLAKAEHGRIEISGLPERYESGRAYSLTIRAHYSDLKRGGFQMSARFADGRQAGLLAAVDARTVVMTDPESGVAFAFHSEAGLAAIGPGTATWSARWTAPATTDPVIVSIAVNASNADDSALGDVILLARREIRPARKDP